MHLQSHIVVGRIHPTLELTFLVEHLLQRVLGAPKALYKFRNNRLERQLGLLVDRLDVSWRRHDVQDLAHDCQGEYLPRVPKVFSGILSSASGPYGHVMWMSTLTHLPLV